MDYNNDYLAHHGILGMHWGIRRFQPYSVHPRKGGEGGKEVGDARKSSKIDSKTRDKEIIDSFSRAAEIRKKALDKMERAFYESESDEDFDRREKESLGLIKKAQKEESSVWSSESFKKDVQNLKQTADKYNEAKERLLKAERAFDGDKNLKKEYGVKATESELKRLEKMTGKRRKDPSKMDPKEREDYEFVKSRIVAQTTGDKHSVAVAKEVLKGKNTNPIAKEYEKAMRDYVDSYHTYIHSAKAITTDTLSKIRDVPINNPNPPYHNISDTSARSVGERYMEKMMTSTDSKTLVVRNELIDLYKKDYGKYSWEDVDDFKHIKRKMN